MKICRINWNSVNEICVRILKIVLSLVLIVTNTRKQYFIRISEDLKNIGYIIEENISSSLSGQIINKTT